MPCSHPKMSLKSAPQNLNLLIAKDMSKSYTLDCSCTLMPLRVPAYLRIAMKRHLREKPFCVKIPIFFLARTSESWVKWMLYSQRAFNIKISLCWTVFEILLRQHLFEFKEFCMETRLSTIVEITGRLNCYFVSLNMV